MIDQILIELRLLEHQTIGNYLLNIHQLERQGSDLQTKVDHLEQLNQSMRDHDKMKDDAIAHLSDQLVAITTRLPELERRQHL